MKHVLIGNVKLGERMIGFLDNLEKKVIEILLIMPFSILLSHSILVPSQLLVGII